MTQILAAYSETGGATKTTTAVSLAAEAARAGLKTLLIDLDPRGAATKWLGLEPVDAGLHVGAILADEEPLGWAADLAVPTPWHPRLSFIPSAREVSLREKESADHSETRLRLALTDVDFDAVFIDCPNRQGGPLTLNALTAATDLIIAAKADEDGLDGIDGAVTTLARYRRASVARGLPEEGLVQLRGIVIGDFPDTIITRDARRAIDVLREHYRDHLLTPLIPHRQIVKEARSAGDYFGGYEPAGALVAGLYAEIAERVLDHYPNKETR